MNIAVIGSREGFTKEQVSKVIYEQFDKEEDRLITGGARGVDTFAEQTIEEDESFANSPWVIKPVDPTQKIHYLFRNVEIITAAERIIAFWDGKSPGTKFVIDYAKARKKEIQVISCSE